MASTKNLTAKVAYGDLKVELTAENVSMYPDIADDLMSRMKTLWRDALEAMMETNAWEAVDVDDE